MADNPVKLEDLGNIPEKLQTQLEKTGFNIDIFLLLQILGGILILLILYKILKILFRDTGKVYAPGGIIDSKSALKIAKRAEKEGNFVLAGDMYHSVGNIVKAAELYERARLYSKAADLYIDSGNFNRAVQVLEKSGNFEKLAMLYARQNNFQKAGEIFERYGNYTMAADMYEKVGNLLKAAEAYEKGNFYLRAGELYRECKRYDKAGEMFKKTYYEELRSRSSEETQISDDRAPRLAYNSAECYYKAGKYNEAIEILSTARFFQKAGEIALEIKDYEKAADFFIKANNPLKAAEALELKGDVKRASELRAEAYISTGEQTHAAEELERAGNYLNAAEIYRNMDNFEKAGQMYLMGGDFYQAAEMFLKAKQPRSAAIAYERAREYLRAAEIYKRLGDYLKQAELLERTGNFYEAGVIYHENNQIEKALTVLQKVDKNSRNYRKACVLLGDMFKEKKMLTQAIYKYRDAIAGEGVNKFTLHPYYNLARVLEEHGNTEAALEIYERILSEDYTFSDVAQRVENLRIKAKAVSQAKRKEKKEKRFELLEEIGRGGMGIVYKAKDLLLNRTVAYKILPGNLKDNPGAVENFLREARAAASLNHKNIVTIYDIEEEDGEYVIVMEFVEGITLKKKILEIKQFPLKDAINIINQLCDALDYAHKNRVVHRDIKPNNIMLTPDGTVKILDFGLAKILEEVISLQTRSMGTPYYVSPEQIIGDPKIMPVDHRTDIYSLGVTMFELVTGTLPFTKGDISYHHIHTPPPVPSSVAKVPIPREIDRIILKCLEKEPNKRYFNAMEIAKELSSIKI